MRNKIFKKISLLLLPGLMASSVCSISPLQVAAMDSAKGIEIEVPHAALDQAVEDARNSGAAAVKDNVQGKNTVLEAEADYNGQIAAIQAVKTIWTIIIRKKQNMILKKRSMTRIMRSICRIMKRSRINLRQRRRL